MRITGNIGCPRWQVEDADGLMNVLAWRDALGGGIFFLEHDDAKYPYLCIRVSGDVADVVFYSEDGHCGFRCLGGEGLPEDGHTILLYEGCDPGYGEEEPNRFIVPFATACSIATEFLGRRRMPEVVSWIDPGL